MASIRALLVGALLLAACGSGGAGSADPGTAPVTLCDGPAGTWTDLSSEPEWFRDDSAMRINWTDDTGCAINLEYVFHRFGDDHCEWEAAEFISIGVPIGTRYSENWEPMFFHNTDGAVGHLDPGTSLDDLPADAVDTGLRAAGDRELWSNADESELYLRSADDILVFVPGKDDELSCA